MVSISQTRKLRPRGGYFPAIVMMGRMTLCHTCGWSSLGVRSPWLLGGLDQSGGSQPQAPLPAVVSQPGRLWGVGVWGSGTCWLCGPGSLRPSGVVCPSQPRGPDWGSPPGPDHGDRQNRCRAGTSVGLAVWRQLQAAELVGASKAA